MNRALEIMESLRAGRIHPHHAVVLLMYEARWPRDAAEAGVYGSRDMLPFQAMQMPQPCGCDEEQPRSGTVEDLIGALQQQVEDVAVRAGELKAEGLTAEPARGDNNTELYGRE